MKRITVLLSLSVLVCLPIRAQDVRALVGLRGVAVRVYVERHNDMPARLNEAALQTAVELRLRKTNLNVAKSEDAPAIAPRLLVAINAVEHGGTFTYSVIVSLIESATVERNGATVRATIWQSDVLASGGDSNAVRQTVSDEVDNFINDWMAANSKNKNPGL